MAAYVEHGLAYLKHQQASTNGFESDDEGNRVAPPANPYTDAVGKTTLWKMLRGDARHVAILAVVDQRDVHDATRYASLSGRRRFSGLDAAAV